MKKLRLMSPVKKISALMSNEKMFRKLLFCFILVVVIPILLMSLLCYAKFHQLIQNEVFSLDSKIVDQYAAGVEYKYQIYQSYLVSLTSDSSIVNTFRDPAGATIEKIALNNNDLSQEIGLLMPIEIKSDFYNVKFYSTYPTFPVYGYISNSEKAKEEPWSDDLKNNRTDFCYVTPGMKTHLLCLTKTMARLTRLNQPENLCTVKLDVLSDRLFAGVSSGSADMFEGMFIFNSRQEMIYSRSQIPAELRGRVAAAAADLTSDSFVATVDGVKKLVVFKPMNGRKWEGVFLFDLKLMDSRMAAIANFIIIAFLLILAIFVAVIFFLSRALSNRLVLLTKKMQAVEGGDLSVPPVMEGNDEIATIDRQFNRMLQQLHNLISEVYVKEIEKKDAQIKALQYQINPHFLYNTLEMISSMSISYQRREIAVICQKLGEIFRYNIGSPGKSAVPLKDELRHIRNYLYIEDQRFRGQFEVSYDIPGELLECQIIKFILQPIVENIFLHAMKEDQSLLHIGISAREKDGRLEILVRDDGRGMSPQQTEELNQRIAEEKESDAEKRNGSIGLKNVSQRIRLYYGDSYGIRVESAQSEGTLVTVSVPISRE